MNAQHLMEQAPMTVGFYLAEAVKAIDSQLGDGYAAAHPELVAAFVAECGRDFQTAIARFTLEETADLLVGALGSLGETLSGSHDA